MSSTAEPSHDLELSVSACTAEHATVSSGNDSCGDDAAGPPHYEHRRPSQQQSQQSQPPPPIRRYVSTIDEPQTLTGIFGAASNLVNSVVGAGIIGVPYAFAQSGLLGGILLLLMVGWFTDKSLRMVVEVSRFHPVLHDLNVLTYEDLMTIPFGKAGRWFILSSMFIFSYGCMVAYLVIVKDTVPTVLGSPPDGSFWEREMVMVASSFFIMLPLSMLRDISELACTSTLSVLADVILVIIVCIHAPVGETVEANGGLANILKDHAFSNKIFIGIGVLSTAFSCQHSGFLIAGSLKDATPQRWAKTTCLSISTATLMCMVFGIVGYLGFLTDTKGDVLNNFTIEGAEGMRVIHAARILLAVTMFLTYPIQSFVLRHIVAIILYNGTMDNPRIVLNGDPLPEQKLCGLVGRREIWSFNLYIASLIPALIFDDVGPVLSVTGALGAASFAFIAPGLVYLGINGTEFLEWTQQFCGSSSGRSNNTPSVVVSAELPMDGDATLQLQQTDAAAGPEKSVVAGYPTGRKPWWWYPAGFPLWCAIACQGATNTRIFLEHLHEGNVPSPPRPGDETHPLVRHANTRDFFVSMILIICGALAAVLGLVSNIYVQVDRMFFQT